MGCHQSVHHAQQLLSAAFNNIQHPFKQADTTKCWPAAATWPASMQHHLHGAIPATCLSMRSVTWLLCRAQAVNASAGGAHVCHVHGSQERGTCHRPSSCLCQDLHGQPALPFTLCTSAPCPSITSQQSSFVAPCCAVPCIAFTCPCTASACPSIALAETCMASPRPCTASLYPHCRCPSKQL